MKILVLGDNAMLGHHFLELWKVRHDVEVTLTKIPSASHLAILYIRFYWHLLILYLE